MPGRPDCVGWALSTSGGSISVFKIHTISIFLTLKSAMPITSAIFFYFSLRPGVHLRETKLTKATIVIS